MVNETSVRSNVNSLIFPKNIDVDDTPPILKLPTELIDMIFTFLERQDLRSTRRVCHLWNQIIDTHLSKKINRFFNFLSTNLTRKEKRLIKIQRIKKDFIPKQILGSNISLRNLGIKVIPILTKLELKRIDCLDNLYMGVISFESFKSIFSLASLNKITKSKQSKNKKLEALQILCGNLIKQCKPEESLIVMTVIDRIGAGEKNKEYYLNQLIDELLKNNKIDEAIHSASHFSKRQIENLSKKLWQMGNMTKAAQIAHLLDDFSYAETSDVSQTSMFTLKNMILILLQDLENENCVKKAIEIASMAVKGNSDHRKALLLSDIARMLIKKDKRKEAIKAELLIPDAYAHFKFVHNQKALTIKSPSA